MPDLRLIGCRSRPLIGYLKALGVLRIVSRASDPAARGRWRDGAFQLRSSLDDEGLSRLLLDEYAPAPVISPWNGGSGFHSNDRKEAILTLEQAAEDRFAPYRAAIAGARAALSRLGIRDKPESGQKLPLVRELRRTLPDDALPWLDAAIVVTGEDVSYPPLLGSGGNDGRYEFSNNYAQAVVRCLLTEEPERSSSFLRGALHGSGTELQAGLSLGHFLRDSSPTSAPTGEADSLGNPWDLILAVEGALLLVAGAARRLGAASRATLVAPFTVYSTAAGYGSAVRGEKGRAELWLPLWSGWASHAEMATLVREARAQVGRRQATSGLDFARAAGELGVARGIEAFERYAILERAGQSSLAVPVGRVSVSPRDSAEALRSIDRWLERVLRFGTGDHCPNALEVAIRRLEHACFELASRGRPEDACQTLEAMGAVEHALARSRGAIAAGMRPLHRAPAAPWIRAADDGSPEFAVAAAIASLHDGRPGLPALRDYLHGTRDGGSAFDEDRRHVVHANGVARLLAAIHARRHLDAARHETNGGGARSNLAYDNGTWCDLRVARMFAAGVLDDERVLRLLRGLALLDHGARAPVPRHAFDGAVADPPFDLLALAWWGGSLPDQREQLGPRPGWAARLAAGTAEQVVRDALLRLRLAGLPPVATAGDVLAGAPSSQRLGAALLLPLGPRDIESLARRLTTAGHNDEREESP